jgi:hypothetical protein
MASFFSEFLSFLPSVIRHISAGGKYDDEMPMGWYNCFSGQFVPHPVLRARKNAWESINVIL